MALRRRRCAAGRSSFVRSRSGSKTTSPERQRRGLRPVAGAPGLFGCYFSRSLVSLVPKLRLGTRSAKLRFASASLTPDASAKQSFAKTVPKQSLRTRKPESEPEKGAAAFPFGSRRTKIHANPPCACGRRSPVRWHKRDNETVTTECH